MNVIVAMAVFVASHVAIARTGLKPWLVTRLGRRGYLVAYSLLSLALLVAHPALFGANPLLVIRAQLGLGT